MEAERRYEPWPWALGTLLAGMMATCLLFLSVAIRHPDAEVVPDAYLAGLAVNGELLAERRAEALGLALSLVARPAPGGVQVEVAVRGADGKAASVRSVVVERERPAEGALDARFELVRRGAAPAALPGAAPEPPADAFVAVIPLPRPGRWHLVATAQVGEAQLRRVFAVFAPTPASGVASDPMPEEG